MTHTRGGSQHLGPPSPLIIRLGRWEWHGMTLEEEGGGETHPLNTSPTDRCHWPFLNLIIVVPTQGEDGVGFSLTSPSIPLFPLPIRTPSRTLPLLYRLTHLYTDAYAWIYLSICLADVADVPMLKMAILTDWSPLSLLSISQQIKSLCVIQWFINLQYLLRWLCCGVPVAQQLKAHHMSPRRFKHYWQPLCLTFPVILPYFV